MLVDGQRMLNGRIRTLLAIETIAYPRSGTSMNTLSLLRPAFTTDGTSVPEMRPASTMVRLH